MEDADSVMQVYKIVRDAEIPRRATTGSVGHDLVSVQDLTIGPRSQAVIGTGIAVRIPRGTYGRIAPCSALSTRHHCNVGAGVLDPDYRGEVKVLLQNLSSESLEIHKRDRIAQLVLERCVLPCVVQVAHETDLGSTSRAPGGFGPTNTTNTTNTTAPHEHDFGRRTSC